MNLADNSKTGKVNLDAMDFAIFGYVDESEMPIVEKVYSGYGEMADLCDTTPVRDQTYPSRTFAQRILVHGGASMCHRVMNIVSRIQRPANGKASTSTSIWHRCDTPTDDTRCYALTRV